MYRVNATTVNSTKVMSEQYNVNMLFFHKTLVKSGLSISTTFSHYFDVYIYL